MLLGLSDSLPYLVEAKYKAAKAAQSLTFSPTELAIIRTTTGVPFQLRYCPTLAKKPTPKKDDAPKTKKPDPFDNPSSDLLIADVPATDPTHLLVLNKFPIIAGHFILATKSNKQQTHVLELDDLEATYACLKAWENGESHIKRKRLFAFFNSGEHSGASQPHRHLQLLPVESMREPPYSDGWDPLVDLLQSPQAGLKNTGLGLMQHPELPFTQFAVNLSSDPSATELLKAYQELYQAAKASVDEYIRSNSGDLELHATEDGSLPISYNLAMTTSYMAICPRRREGGMLRKGDVTDIGPVALNGTILAGTLMVKQSEEWAALREQPGILDTVLKSIGIPLLKNQAAL